MLRDQGPYRLLSLFIFLSLLSIFFFSLSLLVFLHSIIPQFSAFSYHFLYSFFLYSLSFFSFLSLHSLLNLSSYFLYKIYLFILSTRILNSVSLLNFLYPHFNFSLFSSNFFLMLSHHRITLFYYLHISILTFSCQFLFFLGNINYQYFISIHNKHHHLHLKTRVARFLSNGANYANLRNFTSISVVRKYFLS